MEFATANNPVNNDLENLEVEIGESQSDEPSKKRAKSTTSDVWNFFTKLGGKDGIERARCNACKQEYKVGGKLYGISSLKRHIQKCKKI